MATEIGPAPSLLLVPSSSLRQTVSRIVFAAFAGITAGVAVGGVLGTGFVIVNHYIGEGYPRLALVALRDSLNRYALAVGGLFVLIGLTHLLFRDRSRAHVANTVLWLLAATAAVLWRLRLAPETPGALSLRGVLLFSAVAMVGLGACQLAAWQEERLRRGVSAVLHGLGGVKPVAAALLLWAGANAGSAALASRQPPPRLNVLLLTIDALRADHLGAYGYARPTSPNIDRLAREGVLFRRAVAQWPKTSPSFASMMSSTYGHTNGLIRTTAQRMPDRFLLLAELLKAGGYTTEAAVGNVNLARVFNFDQGFDTYLELWREGDEERTEETTRRGLDLLRQASAGRPFFLWLHYFDPHARYQPPAPFDGMFVNDAHFDGSRRAPLYRKRQDIGGIPSFVNLGRENRIAYYVAQYDAEIRYVDQQVGILMQALEEQGLAGRTLVILTADHGESLGDHNYFFEHGRFPYDDCVHVPLILRGPGTGRPGAVLPSPVELIDLVPTVLDLAGLPPDPQAEGKSLRRLLAGERPGSARWAYAFNESGYAEDYQRAITSDRYKLIYVPDPRDRSVMQGRELELYDLEKDPGETKNLIDRRPDVAAPLKRRLSRWIADSGSGAAVPAAVQIDAAAEDQLRSLGYVE